MSKMCLTKYLYAIANNEIKPSFKCEDCHMRHECKQKDESAEEELLRLYRGATDTMKEAVVKILQVTQKEEEHDDWWNPYQE